MMTCTCGHCMRACIIDGATRLLCYDCQRVTMLDGSPEPVRPTAMKLPIENQSKQNKYHVSPIAARTVDGTTFASKREMERWKKLKLLERAGKIHGLSRQVSFALVANDVVVERYVADFVYYIPNIIDSSASWIVEDSKMGVKTSDYKRKKKWMQSQLGITILETK